MAGYLAKFFFCVFMDHDRVEVHKLTKKRMKPICSHLDGTDLVNNGLITCIWLLGNFSCGTWWEVPNELDSSILPTWVSNHSAEFDSSCLLQELGIYYMYCNYVPASLL